MSITRAPSSTPPQHKGQEQQPDQQPQTDIIEISDDSSPGLFFFISIFIVFCS